MDTAPQSLKVRETQIFFNLVKLSFIYKAQEINFHQHLCLFSLHHPYHPTTWCTQWPGYPGNSSRAPPYPDTEGCLCFFIHGCSTWASCQRLALTPQNTEMTLFYSLSPVSCKAGGQGLLRINHAPCRKLPGGCHNSLVWRTPPLLNPPTPPSIPLLCLHH